MKIVKLRVKFYIIEKYKITMREKTMPNSEEVRKLLNEARNGRVGITKVLSSFPQPSKCEIEIEEKD